MNQSIKGTRQEFLEHWVHLSEVQRRALFALAKEMQMASDLVETSMIDLSQRFIALAQTSQKQKETLAQLAGPFDETAQAAISEAQKQSETICAEFSDIVTKMQFQDRTAQRLSVIGDALTSLGMMMEKAQKETMGSNVLTPQKSKEDEWVKEMVANMHLDEVRERFIQHALFAKDGCLFDGDEDQKDDTNYADASDDIELF